MATPFTQEEQDLIQHRLAERGIGGMNACPLCHRAAWSLGNSLVLLPSAGSLGFLGNPQASYPCVALFCENCGNTHLISLGHIGLEELASRVFYR